MVRVGIGVRDGSVGRLSERDALGTFEPPPHDAIRTRAIARSAFEGTRILLAGFLHLFELRGQLVGGRIDLEEMQRFTEPTVLQARPWVACQISRRLSHRMEAGAAATSVARPDLLDRSVVRWVRYEIPCFASRDRSRAG